MGAEIRIALCDDHVIFRKGIELLLNQQSNMQVVAGFSDGETLVKEYSRLAIDIILLDINMDGRNGIETLKQLNSMDQECKVVMLSMNPPDLYGIRAFKAGAMAYLQKTISEVELIEAVNKVASGRKYLTDEVTNLLLEQERVADGGLKVLSDRELEVLTLYARDLTNKEIGVLLKLSPKTISTHKKNILRKMGESSIAEAIKHIKNT